MTLIAAMGVAASAGAGGRRTELPDGASTVNVRFEQRPATGTERSRYLLRIDAPGGPVTLVLFESAVVDRRATATSLSDDSEIAEPSPLVLQGRVRGAEGSVAAATVHDGRIDAVVRVNERLWVLEPLTRFEPDADRAALLWYAGAVARARGLEAVCATTSDPDGCSDCCSGCCGGEQTTESDTVADAGGYSVVELVVLADSEFTTIHGSETSAYIYAVANAVDALFLRDLGLQLRLSEMVTFATEPDPFSETSATGRLVEAGALRAEAGGFLSEADTVHLMTGIDLDGPAVGAAYVSAACHPTEAVSLSEDRPGLDMMVRVVAHEIAHNVGAHHDGELGSPCQTVPEGYIMWPQLLAAADAFSECSHVCIDEALRNAPCIAHGIPLDCGDGLTDPSEQCDDGNNEAGDCCSPTCTLEPEGTTCGEDADPCTDQLCDGDGACVQTANEAPCDDGEACTADGRCADGSCIPSLEPRQLTRIRLRALHSGGPGEDLLKLTAAWPQHVPGSSPLGHGLSIRLWTASDPDLLAVEIPADGFTPGRRNDSDAFFPARGTSACWDGGCAKARVKLAQRSGMLALKTRITELALPAAMTGAELGVAVSFGDEADDECAMLLRLDCRGTERSIACRQP